eukprot:3467330-Lingulodinium_polyedra.AAC.1
MAPQASPPARPPTCLDATSARALGTSPRGVAFCGLTRSSSTTPRATHRNAPLRRRKAARSVA